MLKVESNYSNSSTYVLNMDRTIYEKVDLEIPSHYQMTFDNKYCFSRGDEL